MEKLLEEKTYCEICGKKKAVITCPKCGRRICKDCYNEEKKACIICSATLCEICGENHATDTCQICGRQVCGYCSKKINEVKTICNKCLENQELEKIIQYLNQKIRETNKKLATLLKA